MRFGLNTPTPELAPIWVAKEEGLFARYGIEVELVTIPGADLIVASLLAGDLPLSILGATALVNSAVGGSDLVYVGSFNNVLHFKFYGRPEIGSVADLRGKPVAITSRGGVIRRVTESTLQRHGLDPERDVTLVVTGNVPNSTASLISGAVAAAMISPPATFQAEDEGMRLLVDTTEYQIQSITSGIAGSRTWIADNADLARRTLQAIAEGIAFAHRDKERTKAIIGRYAGTEDAILLERTYHAQLPNWQKDLRVPPEAIRGDLEFVANDNPAARSARPEQLIDNRPLEELERQGFFPRVWQ
jgi:NitT/TauT family transport system substrate-binding protein